MRRVPYPMYVESGGKQNFHVTDQWSREGELIFSSTSLVIVKDEKKFSPA